MCAAPILVLRIVVEVRLMVKSKKFLVTYSQNEKMVLVILVLRMVEAKKFAFCEDYGAEKFAFCEL